MLKPVSYTHLDVYKRQILSILLSLYLITGVNWQTPCQLCRTLMMVSDGVAETFVNNCRPRPNSPTDNSSFNNVDANHESLRTCILTWVFSYHATMFCYPSSMNCMSFNCFSEFFFVQSTAIRILCHIICSP